MSAPFGLVFYLLSGFSSIILLITLAIYGLPVIQSLLSAQRYKWIEGYFSEKSSSGQEEDRLREELLNAAKPVQLNPSYRFLKFYLIAAGVATIFFGLIMMLPFSDSGVGRKIILFLPAIVGLGMYYVYTTQFMNQSLWRELAGLFLLGGVASTLFLAFEEFDLDKFLRSDLYLYAILGFGIWVMHHLKSIVASYVYMGLIIYGSSFVMTSVGNNWMFFMTHFIWFFAVGILSFWLPRLREAKQIDVKEIIFGVLFFYMMLVLAAVNTSGLSFLGVAVMLPCLYIFSKIHFKKATWIGARPIELLIGVALIVGAFALTQGEVVKQLNSTITLFSTFSFHRLIAIFIVITIGMIAYTMYSDTYDQQKKSINLLTVFFPISAFVLVLTLNNYGTQYLVNIALIAMGWVYLSAGLKLKDVVRLFAGSLFIIGAVIVRFYKVIIEQNNQYVTGFVLIMVGVVTALVALYMHTVWNDTEADNKGVSGLKD